MKQIVKTDLPAELFIPAEAFSAPVRVQGGTKECCGNLIKITSGGRYKLFTESEDLICIAEGEGHFKWARGEIGFHAKECFSVKEAGEYELNGKGIFLILRK